MKPNILFFIMDDFPMDDIGCYCSNGRTMTPTIDDLSAEGVQFDCAYSSSSVCTPTRYSYMTGHYAGRNTDSVFMSDNVEGDVSKINFNVVVNENIPNLMTFLKDAGYQTGYSGKWHCGKPLGQIEGMPTFDFEESPADADVNARVIAYQEAVQAELKKTLKVDYAKSIAWSNVDELPLKALRQHNLEWMTKGTLDILDSFEEDKPFCLYMATSTFHGPLQHKSLLEADPRYTWSGYDESLSSAVAEREMIKNTLLENGMELNHHTVGALWTDYQFRKVQKALADKGVLENTIVVFAIDHGVEPGKGSCYEMGIRVPLIIKWPDGYRKSEKITMPVQNVDLVPTLLAACDIEQPKNVPLDGVDIRKLLDGEIKREILYFEGGFYRAIIKNRMKYITLRYPQRILDDIQSGKISMLPNSMDMERQQQPRITVDCYANPFAPDQVYDLANDLFETTNLVDDAAYKDVCAELRAELQGYLDTFVEHPYNLDDYKVFDLPEYETLKENRRAMGLGDIEWWNTEDSIEIKQRMHNILNKEVYQR